MANLHLRPLRLLTQPALWPLGHRSGGPGSTQVDAGYQSEVPLAGTCRLRVQGPVWEAREDRTRALTHPPPRDPEKPPGSTRQEENGGRLGSCHFNVANS